MAFIKIISLPGGKASSCTKYYYKNGSRQNDNKKWIGIGEIAEVPDEELDIHLASGKVMQVRGLHDASPAEEPRRRAKARQPEDGFDAVFAAQR